MHGNIEELKLLFHHLNSLLGTTSLTKSTIVFLGDYCDRGPNTKAVLDYLIELSESRSKAGGGKTYFCCGNHDFAFAAYLGCLPSPTSKSTTTSSTHGTASDKMHFEGNEYDEGITQFMERDRIGPMHPELLKKQENGSCGGMLISGHHGCFKYSQTTGRLLLDDSGGVPSALDKLQAVVIPEKRVVNHDGSTFFLNPIESKDESPSCQFVPGNNVGTATGGPSSS